MATSNEKQVQLKRETLLNDEAVLEDIFPKTMTDAVVDTNSGLSMSEMLDIILTAINNKLSRNVNSVNGRSGVVLLSAADVGLGNVDNVSNADLKAWVINYVAQQFHDKHMILADYYDEIQSLVTSNNDQYDGVPFVCRHETTDPNDQTMVIGYMYKDGSNLRANYYTFDFGDKGVGRFEYDSNSNVLGEYFNMYDNQNRNYARGLYSTAKGYKNSTDAQASMVSGSENTINSGATNSFVMGDSNECFGTNSIVFGKDNKSVGNNSFVVGQDNQNIQPYSVRNIVGGDQNILTNSGDSIVSGYGNQLTRLNTSFVTGENNQFQPSSGSGEDIYKGMIIGGELNDIHCSSNSVITGKGNLSADSTEISIFGTGNKCDTTNDSLACGYLNTIKSTSASSISGLVGGFGSVVSGNGATAIGNKVEAKGTSSFIVGLSSRGFNEEEVRPARAPETRLGTRYNGIGNMTLSQIYTEHKTSPFSLAYGEGAFVAGKDNIGVGEFSVTAGNRNVNKSEGSLVSGYNNIAGATKGLTVSGTNNFAAGQFSSISGVRNTTSGHAATSLGAFNDAGNYAVVLGIGSQLDLAYPDFDSDGLMNLKYSTKLNEFSSNPQNLDEGAFYTMKQWILRAANYIDIPVPLLFCPMQLQSISIRITYASQPDNSDLNEWISSLDDKYILDDPSRDTFIWQDDTKALRLTKESMIDHFIFNHTYAPGYEYNLGSIDLRDAEFFITFTAVPNIAEKVAKYAFKVGNGPFSDSIYKDKAGHADAFKVGWDGRTYTQKDMVLEYKADPNTADPPIQISIKKLIDTLIAGNYITLQDIQFSN